jgi:hypothetical protein
MDNKERRKYPRVPLYTPLAYICKDSEGNYLYENMGVARNVSQSGIQIETTHMIKSKKILLIFLDLENKSNETEGEIVYCRQNESGTYFAGIKFLNPIKENIKFVGGIVRFNHYQKDTPRAIISPAIPN